MSLIEIFKIFILAVFVPASLWFLYKAFKVAEEGKQLREQEDFNAPYKVEPDETLSKYDFSPHVMAVSEEYNKDQPTPRAKRKYTKRSKYWGSSKLKAKLKKARKARGTKKKTRRVIL